MPNGPESRTADLIGPAATPASASIAAGEGATANRCRAYYLGSGAIAVPTLAALDASPDVELVGQGTQPDRPQGRKNVMQPTPVGAWCDAHGKTVDKPENVNDPSFLRRLQALQLDVIIVFSFGQILSKALLCLPRLGCLNIHASLLPRHRGASPISAAILAGDAESGITYMRCVRKLDAGPTFSSHRLALTAQETAPRLEERVAVLAAETISSIVDTIHRGLLLAVPQDDHRATTCGKLSKQDGWVDWAQPASLIERQVRAYLGWPGARTTVETPKGRRQLILTAATVHPDPVDALPGTILQANAASGLLVACRDRALRILQVIPEGKKEMTSSDYLRGCPLQEGSILRHETTDL